MMDSFGIRKLLRRWLRDRTETTAADSTDIRDQLLKNNPFYSGSVSDPWENDDPDVISLNQEAYSHIC